MMGDHRSNSADSRFHLDEAYHGTVSEDGVIGRAVVIGWPFDRWKWLEEPGTFGSVPDAPGRSDTALVRRIGCPPGIRQRIPTDHAK